MICFSRFLALSLAFPRFLLLFLDLSLSLSHTYTLSLSSRLAVGNTAARRPSLLQQLLLRHTRLATAAQSVGLLYEMTFLPVVIGTAVVGNAGMGLVGWALLLGYGIFGLVFHAAICMTMSIDFLRFWAPALLATIIPAIKTAMGGTGGYLGTALPDGCMQDGVLCGCIGAAFAYAHLCSHSGLQWPLSSFDLYNTYYPHDTLEYAGLDLLTADGSSFRSFHLRR
jgi:hypothetical protein